ncbi:MAG: hypothetical protein M3Y08_08495 [Fibrobacterota bacterium]|nr:hypothetical protein [Fibrobacterota bacterium]
MIRSIPLLILCFLSIAGLIACDKEDSPLSPIVVRDTVRIATPVLGTVFRLVLKVQDARTRLPLAGAEASLLDGGKGAAGKDGIIRLDSLGEGASLIHVSMAGYAGQVEEVTAESGESQAAIKTLVRTIEMHKLGAALTGRLYLQPIDRDSALEPVANARIELRLPVIFTEPFRTTQTSATGEFILSDLPEAVGYSLSVPTETRAGVNYRLGPFQSDGSGLVAGEKYRMSSLVMESSVSGALFILTPMEVKVKPEDKVEIRFSGAIDTGALAEHAIKAFSVSSPRENEMIQTQEIALEHGWREGGKVLTVEPFQSGWPVDRSVTIHLSGFKDTIGTSLSGNQDFGGAIILMTPSPTGGALEAVDSVWISPSFFGSLGGTTDMDNSASSYNLTWTPVPGATQYEVYTREDNRALWSLTSVTTMPNTFYSAQGPVNYAPLQRRHMIIPRNGMYRGRFSEAMELTLKDNVRPRISKDQSQLQRLGNQSMDNSSGTSDMLVDFVLRLRSNQFMELEPLDTTRSPQARLFMWGLGESSPVIFDTYSWLTPNTARIILRVPPGVDARYHVLEINFQILMDLAGNLVGPVEGNTAVAFTLN